MRLLNASTFKLEEFFGEPPPYAILSHTWEQDEVLFKDIENLTQVVREKKGFSKIEHSCALALSQHLQYVWIDTCCIDKSSSAELSEAINSMFRYYHESKHCYVYLSDLETGYGEHLSAELERCRWFTRGWTLQELLASKSASFFNRTWQLVGTNRTLQGEIRFITGIPSGYIDGYRELSDASVARRLSWASKRETTRDEDIAYCLLGIFGVNLSPIYGEGKKKAFLRLQEAILKEIDDDSLLAWDRRPIETSGPDGAPCYGLLAPSPKSFVDCGDIVAVFDWARPVTASMNSSGLAIKLPLARTHGNYFDARLKCTKGSSYGSGKPVVIHLLRLPGQNVHYARVFDSPRLGSSKMTYVDTQCFARHSPFLPKIIDDSVSFKFKLQATGLGLSAAVISSDGEEFERSAPRGRLPRIELSNGNMCEAVQQEEISSESRFYLWTFCIYTESGFRGLLALGLRERGTNLTGAYVQGCPNCIDDGQEPSGLVSIACSEKLQRELLSGTDILGIHGKDGYCTATLKLNTECYYDPMLECTVVSIHGEETDYKRRLEYTSLDSAPGGSTASSAALPAIFSGLLTGKNQDNYRHLIPSRYPKRRDLGTMTKDL